MKIKSTSIRVMWLSFLSVSFCLMAEEYTTAEAFSEARIRYNGEWRYPADALASNIYAQVWNLYKDYRSPFNQFLAVRGGGFFNEMDEQCIQPLAIIVSNNCTAIADDWQTYETNEMVRFTTLCAAAYSGFDNYTNFLDRILARYESDTNSCSWATVRFIFSPYGTVSDIALELNYDAPAVSNILQRMRVIAVANDNVQLLQKCDRLMSGEAKRELLELKAGGALPAAGVREF